jgi:hypothetical protein
MVTTLNYLLERQLSPQWCGFLTSLADEFEAQIGPDELRQLMNRVGRRFAHAQPLGECASTVELADALNQIWRDSDWGFVELSDEPDYLRIVHRCAPLTAFGHEALAWTPAFLEGAYEQWLSEMGAEGLSVLQAGPFDENASIEFRLSKNPI